jgi:hypothetical protein
MEYFINPFTLAALVPLIVEALKQQLKWKSTSLFKIFKRDIYTAQVVSQFVAILLAFVGWKFDLGFFSEMALAVSILWGFFIGLAANGAFDAGYLNIVYQFFNQLKTKTK